MGWRFFCDNKNSIKRRKERIKSTNNYSDEILKIILKFHDPISNEERTELFLNLVRDMQILPTGNGKNTYFD